MVNPGAFQGSRKAFLLSQKAAYSAGVAGGYAADALSIIQRQYFKRYPIDLPDDEEPDAEVLASIDDNAPDVEQEQPDEVQLGPEEYATAMSALKARRSAITFRKAVSLPTQPQLQFVSGDVCLLNNSKLSGGWLTSI
jgi:hypothetical protein